MAKAKKKTAKKAVKKKVAKKVEKKTTKSSARPMAGKKAQKTTAKKKPSIVKRAVKKGKQSMPTVTGEQSFWVYEGPILSNPRDLHNALREVNEGQYLHHVNSAKNDFATWMEDVFGDKETARAMRKAKTVSAMIKAVEKSLLRYF